VVSHPRRDEVWLIALDPLQGSEIKKTRPCLVVSPNEMNESPANDAGGSDGNNAAQPSHAREHGLPRESWAGRLGSIARH
jgi:hypothetical protein